MRIAPTIALITLALAASAEAQQTWYVDQSGGGDFTTIQSAIDSSQTLSGDTLLIRDGVYSENINFDTKQLTIASINGPDFVTLQPADVRESILTCGSAIDGRSTLRGLRFTGGGLSYYSALNLFGGAPLIEDCVFVDLGKSQSSSHTTRSAIQANSTSLTIRGCTFMRCEGNTVLQTAGIGGKVTIENCLFQENNSVWTAVRVADLEATDCRFISNYGKPPAVDATGVLVNCEFRDNQAIGNYSEAGAIIGSLDCRNCSFIDNHCDSGPGAARVNNSTFEDCEFLRNSGWAGGAASAANSTFSNCKFMDNFARSSGGAISSTAGPLDIYRCLFVRNYASNHGGALFLSNNSPTEILHCTLVENHSDSNYGAIYSYAFAGDSIRNSIAWGNTAGSSEPNWRDVITEYCDVEFGKPGIGNIDQDPLFVDPANDDLRLQPTSPCVDAGDPNTELDFDGSLPDLGAFRLNPVDLDSDDDGISDDDEVGLWGTDPAKYDSDGDGLGDGLELGFTSGTTDTNPLFFVPDTDPLTTTDPLNADSDGGGAVDGAEDHDGNGAVDTWDTDPNDPGDEAFAVYFSGIFPDGKVHIEVWNATPLETIIPAYSLAGPGPSPTGVGINVDLTRPITLMDPFLSDASGRASVDRLPIPPNAPVGLPVWMQAVEVPISGNLQPRASNPVLIPIGAN